MYVCVVVYREGAKEGALMRTRVLWPSVQRIKAQYRLNANAKLHDERQL